MQDSCSATQRKVHGTRAEKFVLVIELVNWNLFADACDLSSLFFMQIAISTAQRNTKKAYCQIDLLRHTHGSLEEDLQKRFNTINASWKAEMNACRDQIIKDEAALDRIKVSESKRTETLETETHLVQLYTRPLLLIGAVLLYGRKRKIT